MHFVTLLLGGPIGGIPLIMMTIPIFIPVVKVLGYEPVWFCTAMLLNVELAQITPPVRHPALCRARYHAVYIDDRDYPRRRHPNTSRYNDAASSPDEPRPVRFYPMPAWRKPRRDIRGYTRISPAGVPSAAPLAHAGYANLAGSRVRTVVLPAEWLPSRE